MEGICEETLQPEIKRMRGILTQWQENALPNERGSFEYITLAAELFTMAKLTGIPVPIISPTCLNYETINDNGRRRPMIKKEMVWAWDYQHLLKGYVLLHEEIPYLLAMLNHAGVPIKYGLIAVDIGMSQSLFTDANPDSEGRTPQELQMYIESIVIDNVDTMTMLLNDGLEKQGLNTGVHFEAKVVRLSEIVENLEMSRGPNFMDAWSMWNSTLRSILDRQNDRWAGTLRRAVEQDGRYLRELWGFTEDEQVFQRVLDENFGLAAVIADFLHQFANEMFGLGLEHKGQIVMLDTIPGPGTPGYTEFGTYNWRHPLGEVRPPTPILRPCHNQVLFSKVAVEVPFLPKPLETMIVEAETFGF